MARGSAHSRGRPRSRRRWRRRRRYWRPHRSNRWTRRRLGRNWAWRGRNLCRLHRWNDCRFGNGRRRRSYHSGLCFHLACRRRGRVDRLGDNRRRRRRNHGRRWRRSYHGGLHAGRSGGSFFRCLIGNCLLLGLYFRFGGCAKVLAHSYSGLHFDRTGMRFFLGNPGFGQIVNNGFCLNLELASQFVNSDLIRICHCPPGRLLLSVLVRNFG
jgi:hypothetical protein